MVEQQRGIEIVKANGHREIFSEKKLLRSLRRSGATAAVANDILSLIQDSLHDGMQTRDIYKKAFQALHRGESHSVAHKYNLRNAIMELGPEGFAFEKFVGEIFKVFGYSVRTGVIMDGWCIEHEIDVSAKKNGDHIIIECKFHNVPGCKTDLHVALYVRERFQDIEKHHEHINPTGSRHHEGWLVTNTKLTTHAIKYSECVGTKVVGWGYPKKGQGNLEDLIEQTGVYPVTGLPILSKQQKKQLMNNGIVACHQIIRDPKVLADVGISEDRARGVLKEIERFTEYQNTNVVKRDDFLSLLKSSGKTNQCRI